MVYYVCPFQLTKEGEEKAILCAYHFNEGILSIPNILKKVGVSKATYYKYLELKGLKGKVRPYKKSTQEADRKERVSEHEVMEVLKNIK